MDESKKINFRASTIIALSFLIIFILQLFFAVLPGSGMFSSHISTLLAMGGLNKLIIEDTGQYYRLITAGFLHGDFVHLLFNMYAFYIAANFIEGFLSRSWMLFIFLAGVLGASLLSLQLNNPGITSVGASGGIMALFGAILILAWLWIPPSPLRQQLFAICIQVAIMGFLPLLNFTGNPIDYAGHLGGFLTGALIMVLGCLLARKVPWYFMTNVVKVAVVALLLWLFYGCYDLVGSYGYFKTLFT